MVIQPRHFITPEEYLAAERAAETKSEYFNGEVTAMVGASFRHTLIAGNVAEALRPQLRGKGCRVLQSDMRVKVSDTGLYTYPDVSVVCGKPVVEDAHGDTLLNPNMVIEILSPSTEAYDRGGKFAHYRRVATLSDYVLVAQDKPMVEHFARQADGGWLLTEANGLDSALRIPALDCVLALRDLYEQVDFDAQAAGG